MSPVDRLRGFLTLPSNWNGYEGVPPTLRAVEDCIIALRVLEQAVGGFVLQPTPTVGGDGEVGLFWEALGITIELGCRGDGRYGCLVQTASRGWYEVEGALLGDILPAMMPALDELR